MLAPSLFLKSGYLNSLPGGPPPGPRLHGSPSERLHRGPGTAATPGQGLRCSWRGLWRSWSIADLRFILGRVTCRAWPLAWMLAGAWRSAARSSLADPLGAHQGIWEGLFQPALRPALVSALPGGPGWCAASLLHGCPDTGCGADIGSTQGTLSRLLSTHRMALRKHLPGVGPGGPITRVSKTHRLPRRRRWLSENVDSGPSPQNGATL